MPFPLILAQTETTDLSLCPILLLLGVFFPLLAGLALLLLGRLGEATTRAVAALGFFVPAFAGVWLWFTLPNSVPNAAGYFYGFELPLGLEYFGCSLKLGLNGISAPLFAMAGLVGLAAGLYAAWQPAERLRHYLLLLLIMQGGLMGLFASYDVLFYYFFHEIALIPTFLLMIGWGGPGRDYAAKEMAIYLTVGAMLSLTGLLALHVTSGAAKLGVAFDIPTLRGFLLAKPLSETFQTNIYALLLFGFGILVSLFPFHSWAQRTYTAAPTPVSMLHAGVLKKFGLYGLVQIAWPLLPLGSGHWNELLVWLALGNIVIIGLVAIAQDNLKDLVSISSVMHMGYAFLGLATLSVAGVGGAVVMMFAHGLSVALMFLLGNCVQRRTGTLDLDRLGGLGSRTPVLFALFTAGTMAGIGLPGFANFWGELAIFAAVWKTFPWACIVAVSGIVISAIYALRASARVFMGDTSESLAAHLEKNPPSDLVLSERLPALILIAALLLGGLWPKSVSESVNRELTAIAPVKAAKVAVSAK